MDGWYLVDGGRDPSQSKESLQLENVEVGHTDALGFTTRLQGLHSLHPATELNTIHPLRYGWR